MSLQKLAYNGDSKIILNLVNQVNQLIDGGGGSGGVTDVQVDGSSVVTDGIAEIDLTNNYYNKSQTDALLNAKQNALTAGDGIKISSDVISLDYLSVVNGEVCITFEE